MSENFSYVIPGKLAGSARPGNGGDLADDLRRLARRRIRAVVSLTENPLDRGLLDRFGFRSLHVPVLDFTAPALEQVERFLHFVDASLKEDLPVLVHCGAGLGRTGTMLACYLVHAGMAPGEAIETVRRARPGSIETREQEECVRRCRPGVEAESPEGE